VLFKVSGDGGIVADGGGSGSSFTTSSASNVNVQQDVQEGDGQCLHYILLVDDQSLLRHETLQQ
jgi:hypothetical protein